MAETSGNGAPPPRANPDLVGHESAEAALRRLFQSGRMPHAVLMTGPRGIGKATLAYRFARFVLAHGANGDDVGRLAEDEGTLAVPAASGVFRRVASGGHADLLSVERAYDPRRRRLRSEIVVDETREIAAFLRLTAGEGGWRVVIVDGADAMNRSAANALLKILEEPPRQALLLLVAHNPGRLLPTIRSRCRRFPMTAVAAVDRRAAARNLPARPAARHSPPPWSPWRTAASGEPSSLPKPAGSISIKRSWRCCRASRVSIPSRCMRWLTGWRAAKPTTPTAPSTNSCRICWARSRCLRAGGVSGRRALPGSGQCAVPSRRPGAGRPLGRVARAGRGEFCPRRRPQS